MSATRVWVDAATIPPPRRHGIGVIARVIAGVSARVSWWVIDEPAGGLIAQALDTFVPASIAETWPFKRALVRP